MSFPVAESFAMRLFRCVGLEKVAWSLRRLHCPVKSDALVLEVGSGGSPYPRANVLLDAYEVTRERHWVPLKADRPTVLGFAEHLPFKDKAFDFVIASHVLEHSAQPELFLLELQRVGKAGYIEVPDAFFERINPYPDHRLEINAHENELIVRKKPQWIVDKNLLDIYTLNEKHQLISKLISERPFSFHARYYWKDKINYTILNREVDSSWEAEIEKKEMGKHTPGMREQIQTKLLNMARAVLSQSKRNKNIDLLELLICPDCSSESLERVPEKIRCSYCNTTYSIQNEMPSMYPSSKK